MNQALCDINWQNVFEKIGYYTPRRSDVIHRLRQDQKPVNPHTLLEALERLRRQHYGWKGCSDTYLTAEFPELVDEEIARSCQKINRLPFVRTINGCSGHKVHDCWIGGEKSGYGRFRRDVLFEFGYGFPYLSLIFDLNHHHSSEIINRLSQRVADFGKHQGILTEEKINKLRSSLNKPISGLKNIPIMLFSTLQNITQKGLRWGKKNLFLILSI